MTVKSRIYYIPMLLAALLAAAPSPAPTGSVSGRVLIKGTSTGIAGAEVKLVLHTGNESFALAADGDGRYRFESVPEGFWTVVVDVPGFVKRPDDTTKVKVKGQVMADDIKLLYENGTPQYYAAIAAEIVTKVRSMPTAARARAWQSEWNYMREINLPPASRALVARSLSNLDSASIAASPELETYASADVNKVRFAQGLFETAIDDPTKLPGPASPAVADLSPVVLADVVLYQASRKEKAAADRKYFLTCFLNAYGSEASALRVKSATTKKPPFREGPTERKPIQTGSRP